MSDTDSSAQTKGRIETLAHALGMGDDWREIAAAWGDDAALSAVMFLDWDSLPFGGVGE